MDQDPVTAAAFLCHRLLAATFCAEARLTGIRRDSMLRLPVPCRFPFVDGKGCAADFFAGHEEVISAALHRRELHLPKKGGDGGEEGGEGRGRFRVVVLDQAEIHVSQVVVDGTAAGDSVKDGDAFFCREGEVHLGLRQLVFSEDDAGGVLPQKKDPPLPVISEEALLKGQVPGGICAF